MCVVGDAGLHKVPRHEKRNENDLDTFQTVHRILKSVNSWFSLIADPTHTKFSGILLIKDLPKHELLSSNSKPGSKVSLPKLYLDLAHWIILKILLYHLDSFQE